MSYLRAILLYPLALGLLHGQPASGRIEGAVVNGDGAPIAGAAVAALRPQGTAGAANSDFAGRFTISGLNSGTYSLCAQAPGFTDPCTWSHADVTVSIQPSQTTTQTVLRLSKASVVRVRLNDPSSYLNAASLASGAADLLIGVWTPTRLLLPLAETGTDPSGRDYQLSIPANTALKLLVSSKTLKLLDPAGALVPIGGTTVAIPPTAGGTVTTPIVLSVIGKTH